MYGILLILFLFVSSINCQAAITNVRFASGSSLFNEGKDGILEVYYTSLQKWLAVCNYGFGQLEANVSCYMLGFDPCGVPVLNSGMKSNLTTWLSEFNCNTFVPSIPGPTYNLTQCQYLTPDQVPNTCYDHSRDVHLYCLYTRANASTTTSTTTTTTTATPTTTTISVPTTPIPPATCSNATRFQLIGSIRNQGLLLAQKDSSSALGTVCARGFGPNEAYAICRELCPNSAGLQYSQAILYTYQPTAGLYSFSLTGVSCAAPPSITFDNNCSKTWAASPQCSPGMEIGLQCGPLVPTTPTTIPPIISCNNLGMTVLFNTSIYPGLTQNLVSLLVQPLTGCNLTVSNTSTAITMQIPFDGCNPVIKNTSSTISFQFNVSQGGNAASQPLTFALTCNLQRNSSVSGPLVGADIATVRPVVVQYKYTPQLAIYQDSTLQTPAPPNYASQPGQTLYIRVYLPIYYKNSLLVVNQCWASSTADGWSGQRQQLIANKCPYNSTVKISVLNNTDIVFSVPTVYLYNATTNAPLPFYFFCSTTNCDTTETTVDTIFGNQCSQYANCQIVGRRRRRRDVSSVNENEKLVSGGPIVFSSHHHVLVNGASTWDYDFGFM